MELHLPLCGLIILFPLLISMYLSCLDPRDYANATCRVMSASKITFSGWHKAIFISGEFF